MRFAWLCSHEALQPETLVGHAVAAERLGFDMVTGADHFHPWVDDDGAASFVWAWFGAVAQATARVELATSVTCPLFRYHPALVAQAAATIDRLSEGRFRLGVGTGERINEGPLGHGFPRYDERIARMDEAIDIIARLLAGQRVDVDGQHYACDRAQLYSPPAGHVPVWMAAGGPRSATFAGRRADGLVTSVKDSAEAVERVIAPYREAAEARGAPTTVMATRWVVLAADEDEAWQALRPMRGLRAPGRLDEVDPAVLRERADALDPGEVLGRFTVAPDLDALYEAYRPLVTEVGADVVAVQVLAPDVGAALEQVGTELLPRLRDLAASA